MGGGTNSASGGGTNSASGGRVQALLVGGGGGSNSDSVGGTPLAIMFFSPLKIQRSS